MTNQLEINNILRQFYKISGFRISIHDTEFNEIYAYPESLSPYCALIQSDINNKRECIRNDRMAFKKVKETGELAVYRCVHGLFEAVAPIYHYGILSGYLMMGQVCDDKQKYSKRLTQSLVRVVNDESRVWEIFNSIGEVPQELFDSYILIMRVIAEYVTQTNRSFDANESQAGLVMKYIKQNYASKITLDILAEKFSCSQSMLVKCFKREFGTTIMNALMDVRLKKAAEHLKNGRLSVKEIAAECGFSEQNYFSKAFSKHFGCSPSEYRKNKEENP
ncbi:MAG: PocR ligand-binding domain-containing protein [Clostridia bacterium]|nr:PocR ligand-binding domain-containing protein [Clostridia bacterium]